MSKNYRIIMMLLICCIELSSACIYSADESKECDMSNDREIFLDALIASHAGIDKGFEILSDNNLLDFQMQDPYKSPFYNYLDNNLVIDSSDEQKNNVSELVAQAKSIIIREMKQPYLQAHLTFIKNPYKALSTFDLSVLNYVINQKNRVIESNVLKKWVNSQCLHGETLLNESIKVENLEAVKMLRHAGARVDLRDRYNVTPLEIAVDTDNVKIAKILLADDVDVLAKNVHGQSALYKIKSANMVKEFVKSRPFLFIPQTYKDCNNDTPYSLAVKRNQVEVVHALHNAGAKPGIDLNLNRDMWDYAKKNIIMARELLHNGFKKTLKNKNGETLFFQACSDRDIAMMNLLKTVGVDCNKHEYINGVMICPLLYAVKNSYLDVVNELIAQGAFLDVVTCDQLGMTPLHLAIIQQDIEMVKALIAAGAQHNVKSKDGKTPLDYAVDNNYLDGVDQILASLRANKDLSKKYIYDDRFLRKAIKDNNYDLLKRFLKVESRSYFELWCLSHDNMKFLKYLLDNGLYKNMINNKKETLLLRSILKKEINKIELLISFGADVNIDDNFGFTALYYAVYNNYLEGVDALLQATGLDLYRQYGYLGTIFHIAILENKIEVIEKFINRKCNLNITNSFGMTPLHLAVKTNNLPIVRMLLDAGVDLDIQDEDRNVAIELAKDLRIRNMISAEEHRRDMLNR